MLDRTQQLPVRELTGLHLDRAQRRRLPNGMEMMWERDGDMEAVCRLTLMLPGSNAEVRIKAIAGLSIAAMREGAAGMSAEEISDRIDTAGAALAHQLTSHYRIARLNTLRRNAPEMARLMAAIVSDPAYPEAALRTQTERIASRLEIESTKVGFRAASKTFELVYGADHPLLARETPEEIRGVTRADVMAMYRRFHDTARMRLFVAGNVDDALLDEIAEIFGSLESRADGKLDIVPFSSSAPGLYRVDMPKAVQAAISIASPYTLTRHDADYIDLRLAIMALGGYFGSRLSQNIREEKGYTYGISAVLVGNQEGSMLRILTECDPSYVDGVMHEIDHELRRIVTEPPAGDELTRLKRAARMALATSLESAFSRLDYQIDGCCNGYDGAEYYDRQVAAIDALSPERISEIAQRYINFDQTIRVVAAPNE